MPKDINSNLTPDAYAKIWTWQSETMSPQNLRLHKVMFPEKRNKGGSLFRNYKHDQGTERGYEKCNNKD